MPALIEVRGLNKSYPGVVALKDVDLDVRAGEITALVGKNGAGKSTLIKILAGALEQDSGTVTMGGTEVEEGSLGMASDLGIAFVHQELITVPESSVAENVMLSSGFPRRLGAFIDWKELRRQAAAILEDLDDSIDPAVPIGSLSIAQQRVVMIAQALASEARVLMLDEPTASLTETEIEHLHSVVRKLAARGTAVLYVSHRLPEVFSLTERTVVMRDGELVGDHLTAELSSESLISEISGPARQRAEAGAKEIRPPSEFGGVALEAREIGRAGVVIPASFSVREGEVLGIVGLVGSGRTELIRLLVGADRATEGSVLVQGEQLTLKSPRDAAQAGVVLLPEDRRRQGTMVDMTIRENVTITDLPSYRHHSLLPAPSRKRERAGAEKQVAALDVKAPSVESQVSWLSGGNQQKVVLAKWLARGADVLIFDEPTVGIDVDGRIDTYRQINELALEGKAVIFISSDFSEFKSVCDRAIVMREGRLVDEVGPDELDESALVARCYA